MIDFWEILGHAATDDNFRGTMYDTFAKSKAAPDPDAANKFACMFANADYNNARGLVLAKMGPVSLMALGEWFVVSMLHPSSRPLLDNVAGAAQGLLNGYSSTDPVFYRTLGASIVDAGFRDQFNKKNEAAYGFHLSPADRAALAPVIADGTYGAQSGLFQGNVWDQACKDMVMQSQGDPYAHALEAPFQP